MHGFKILFSGRCHNPQFRVSAFCCSSLAWGVGDSPCRWVLWFSKQNLLSGLGSNTLGVLLFQGQVLHPCASLHVSSGTSCFHDRSVLPGCGFILLSYMAVAEAFSAHFISDTVSRKHAFQQLQFLDVDA